MQATPKMKTIIGPATALTTTDINQVWLVGISREVGKSHHGPWSFAQSACRFLVSSRLLTNADTSFLEMPLGARTMNFNPEGSIISYVAVEFLYSENP
jgi:hypothetical protein